MLTAEAATRPPTKRKSVLLGRKLRPRGWEQEEEKRQDDRRLQKKEQRKRKAEEMRTGTWKRYDYEDTYTTSEEPDEEEEVETPLEWQVDEDPEVPCTCWEHPLSHPSTTSLEVAPAEGKHPSTLKCVPSEFDRTDLVTARRAWEFHHLRTKNKNPTTDVAAPFRCQFWTLVKAVWAGGVPAGIRAFAATPTSPAMYARTCLARSHFKQNCCLDFRDWRDPYVQAPKARCFCFVCTPEERAHPTGAKVHYFHECHG
jgi:hypothetical protein